MNLKKSRKEAIIQLAKNKRTEILQNIQNVHITVEKLPIEEVYSHAIETHNHIHKNKENFVPLTSSCHQSILNKISVNYIRHNLTQYHSVIKEFNHYLDKQDLLNTIRSKIYSTIAKTYPELAAECKKQEQEKYR